MEFFLGVFVGIILTIFVRIAKREIKKSFKKKFKLFRKRKKGPRKRSVPAQKQIRPIGPLQLIVQRDDSMYGYQREMFGPGLSSIVAGDKGISPRDRILIRDGQHVKAVGTKIVSGLWICPYTGIQMVHPSEVEIDHIVPLAEAWRSGAQGWAPQKMWKFNRSETNLVAVSKIANRNKSDNDITSWLPNYNVVQYLSDWIRIKSEFGLTVDDMEYALIDQLVNS